MLVVTGGIERLIEATDSSWIDRYIYRGTFGARSKFYYISRLFKDYVSIGELYSDLELFEKEESEMLEKYNKAKEENNSDDMDYYKERYENYGLVASYVFFALELRTSEFSFELVQSLLVDEITYGRKVKAEDIVYILNIVYGLGHFQWRRYFELLEIQEEENKDFKEEIKNEIANILSPYLKSNSGRKELNKDVNITEAKVVEQEKFTGTNRSTVGKLTKDETKILYNTCNKHLLKDTSLQEFIDFMRFPNTYKITITTKNQMYILAEFLPNMYGQIYEKKRLEIFNALDIDDDNYRKKLKDGVIANPSKYQDRFRIELTELFD